MDAFKSLTDTLQTVTKDKAADPINKNEILNLIDDNLVILKTVISTFDEHPDIMKYIQTQVLSVNANEPSDVDLNKAYKSYFLNLQTPGRRLEKSQLLRSIQASAVLSKVDHECIRDSFSSLFNDGTDVGDISLEQIKLSHATLLGYLNLSSTMANWFCYFYTSVVGRPDDTTRLPFYREDFLLNAATPVSNFVNDVLARGTGRNILSVIQSIRRQGDVPIYTSGLGLDSYANLNEYTDIRHLVGSFNVFQPILMVREFFTSLTHWRYKRNVLMRDWLVTKTAVLKMDMEKVNPDSPEYQRMLGILQKYGDMISDYDRRIAKYQSS